MIKKFSVLILAGMIALPAAAMAGGGGMDPADLEKKIDMLSQQLQQLKSQMAEMKADKEVAMVADDEGATMDVDGSRFEFSGDFRARVDAMAAETPAYYSAMNVAQGVSWFTDATSYDPTSPAFGSNAFTVAGTPGSMLGSSGLLANFVLAQLAPAIDEVTMTTATAQSIAENQTAGMLTGVFYGADAVQANDLLTVTTVLMNGDGTVDADGLLDNDLGASMPDFLGITGVTPPSASFSELSQAQKTQNMAALMKGFNAGERAALFSMMGYNSIPANDYSNDSMLTNRFRMNMRVKVMENIDFKGRMAMYKSWGMQNNPVDPVFGGPFLLSALTMDGNRSRQPADNTLVMDRAIVNWNNINDLPIWFSIGRRPTSGGPPGEVRQGLDQRMATPTAYMDYPFDGLTLGYAYNDLFGATGLPGRIRFCYGRGYEAGPYAKDAKSMNDVDFAGISWDVFKTEDRFFAFQAFGAFNMFNVPDGVEFPNPMEFAGWLNGATYNPMDPNANNILDRANLGNIYHTTAVYQAKHNELNYFLSLGWSRTDPAGYDELGTSLLTSWWGDLEEKDGFSVYTGIRYDIDDKGLKLGLEYNYGSEDWIAFTPGHDDIYASKLAVRGQVAEAYLIWDVPAGDSISKYAKAFIRLGYQHQWHEYTGSGFWLGEPVKISELANDPLSAQFYTPIDNLDQVYMSFDVFF